jgi:hypothetical protein
MRDDDAIGHIFDIIERIESDLNLLKELVQKAISEEQFGNAPLVNVTYFEDTEQGTGIDGSILVDAEILGDPKPAAKTSNKERRLAAQQQRAREWAESKSKKKRGQLKRT